MKLWNYLVIITSMILFLEFVGIPTGLSIILNTFGVEINPITSELVSIDLENSGFFSELFGNSGVLLALSLGGAIIVGLFAKSYDTSLIILPALIFIGTTYIGFFSSTMLYVLSTGQAWMAALIAMIIIPLGVGFIMSCLDYFGGRD